MNIARVARTARAVGAVATSLALCACASVTLPPASASGDVVMSLRAANAAAMNAGTFVVAPGQSPDMDASLPGLRGSSLRAPGGSFTGYLADAITADLKASGLYDPAAAIVISGELTESQVDAAIGTGTAHLGARMKVRKAGVMVYDRTFAVSDQWDSSFIGAIAIPEAMNRYTALYQKLAQKMFDDPEFRRAVAR